MTIDHFIYKFTQHISEKGLQLIFYYIFFVNQVIEVLLQKVYELLYQVVQEVKIFSMARFAYP